MRYDTQGIDIKHTIRLIQDLVSAQHRHLEIVRFSTGEPLDSRCVAGLLLTDDPYASHASISEIKTAETSVPIVLFTVLVLTPRAQFAILTPGSRPDIEARKCTPAGPQEERINRFLPFANGTSLRFQKRIF